MEAWIQNQDSQVLKRAISARSRTTDRTPFSIGDWVYVYRQTANHHGWIGPGLVIAIDKSGLWVSMKGHLWKCSREQVRRATAEENLGAELVLELSKELLEDISRGHKRTYRDISDEPMPMQEEAEAQADNNGTDQAAMQLDQLIEEMINEDVAIEAAPSVVPSTTVNDGSISNIAT